jgi:hypothetical protein
VTPAEIQERAARAFAGAAFSRKPTSWNEAVGFDRVDGNEDLLRALPRHPVGVYPVAEFPEPRPGHFVGTRDGGYYLVSTEGFDYARYVARLPRALFAAEGGCPATDAPARRVPPGCCPGCLLEHATEPCALHRAAGELLAVARRVVARYERDGGAWGSVPHDLGQAARAAVARAEGGAR